MFNAVNGRLSLRNGEMDYIRFGSGKRDLVMIPGVGDGLKTVRGTAIPFSILYRTLCSDFTVYAFSRRENIPRGMTTRDMASDQDLAMEALGLKNACVLGVSQGGMISQWLAIDHPDRVGKLILTVTLSRPNPTVEDVIQRWLEMADHMDYKGIMMDTAERSYSEKYLEKARKIYGVICNVGKPKSLERFIIEAYSCMHHDAYDELHKISCPTLVIGGEEDRIVSGEASREIAERIPGCELKMYEGLGHGLYEEEPDFLVQIKEFFTKD